MNINKTIAAALAAGAYMLAMPFPAFAARTVSGSYTLSGDADWTADGIVTLDGATIDLAGYTLKVQAMTGSGSIVSTETPFVDLTTDDASKVVSDGQACNANYPATCAFNNVMDRENIAYVVGGLTDYTAIGWDFGAATEINCYRIYPGMNNNVAHGWPKDWTFEGSDDGSTWTVLDTRAGEEFSLSTWNTYRLDATASYQYYRVKFTAQQGSDRFNVDELEFGIAPVSRLQLDAVAAADSDFSNITLGENVNLALDLSAASGKLAVSSVAGVASGAIKLAPGKLSADVDLTGLGKVTLAGNLDLAGYVLKVDAMTGSGSIVSTGTPFADLTTDDASKVVSDGQACNANYPATCAFNNVMDRENIAYVVGGLTDYTAIGWDFGAATEINCYRIYPGMNNNVAHGWPKDWTFEGSDDGSTWTVLDTCADEEFRVATWNTYRLDNTATYQYFRVKFTAQQGSGRFNVDELEFGFTPAGRVLLDRTRTADSDFSDIALADEVEVFAGDSDELVLDADLDMTGIPVFGTIDLNGYTLTVDSLAGGGTITDTSAATGFTDLTTTNGLSAANKFIWASTNGVEVALAGPNGNGVDGSQYPAERAFDNVWGATKVALTEDGGSKNYSFAYCAPPAGFWANGGTVELNYKFSGPTLVNRYRIYPYSSAGSPGYPTAWTFDGSNDGETWSVLDTRSGQSLAKANWYDFDTVNTVAYLYYRLKISGTAVAKRFDIGEVEFGCRKPGRLVVNVPAGKIVENTDVVVDGNVRLVKDGAGTFVASKSGQTYMGGTEVAEGTLKCGAARAGLFGPEGGGILIAADGVFDIAGIRANNALGRYSFVLDGGTLANTAQITGSTNYQSPMKLSLASDSSIDISAHGLLGTETAGLDGCFDFGGNTLACAIANDTYFRINNMTLENGAFKVEDATTGRVFIGYGGEGVDASSVDFTLNCPLIVRTGCTLKVRDYEALGSADHTNNQTGTMEVYGVFKPTGDYWCGCTLMNGATLDLSSRTTALNAVSSLAYNKNLSFEENAVVNVVLGDKRFSGGKILSWTDETKPANIDTVKFVRADADREYAFAVKGDGLYAQAGLIISIR